MILERCRNIIDGKVTIESTNQGHYASNKYVVGKYDE